MSSSGGLICSGQVDAVGMADSVISVCESRFWGFGGSPAVDTVEAAAARVVTFNIQSMITALTWFDGGTLCSDDEEVAAGCGEVGPLCVRGK